MSDKLQKTADKSRIDWMITLAISATVYFSCCIQQNHQSGKVLLWRYTWFLLHHYWDRCFDNINIPVFFQLWKFSSWRTRREA